MRDGVEQGVYNAHDLFQTLFLHGIVKIYNIQNYD